MQDDFALRLERKGGRIYSEHHTKGEARTEVILGSSFQFPQDDYQVLLFPNPEHYYVQGIARRTPAGHSRRGQR